MISAHQRGLSLFEMLASLALLAMVAVMLAGGLSFGTRVWERGDQRAEVLDQIRAAQAWLRARLTSAYPEPVDPSGRTRVVEFTGTPQFVRFHGPPPAAAAVGGAYIYEIGYTEREGGALWASWRLPHDPGSADETILLKNTTRVQFRYFGAPRRGAPLEWRESWANAENLPTLIALTVIPGADWHGPPWPEMVIALRVTAAMRRGVQQ